MANRFGVLVALACSLSGCPPQDGKDAGPSVDTPLAFCQQYTSPEAACDFLPGCGAFDTREGCLTALRAENNAADCSDSEFVSAANDGWVHYDPVAGAKCLADFKTTCAILPASCEGVFTGIKSAGEPCRTDTCVTGFYCASDGGCPGTCAPKKPVGTVVRSSTMCIEGTKSHFGLPDGGFGSYCQTPVGEGQSCADTECIDGLMCGLDDTCIKPYALGAKCTGQRSYECGALFGVTCLPALDGGDRHCGKLAKRGEACGLCTGDLRCVIPQGQQTGVCGDLGTSGQSCRDDNECVIGLYCNTTLHQCEAPHAVNTDCSGSARCVQGTRCSFEFPNDGGFTPEYWCRTDDGGTTITIQYCEQTEP